MTDGAVARGARTHPNMEAPGSLIAAPLCERWRSVQQGSLTSHASIQLTGPRKPILPMSTPLWRRIAYAIAIWK